MAGVYIKGIEMPKCCEDCKLYNMEYDACNYNNCSVGYEYSNKRMEDCPLVPVPDHGDLLDRDELAHDMWLKFCENCIRAGENMCDLCTDKQYIDLIVNYPAAISADKEKNYEYR